MIDLDSLLPQKQGVVPTLLFIDPRSDRFGLTLYGIVGGRWVFFGGIHWCNHRYRAMPPGWAGVHTHAWPTMEDAIRELEQGWANPIEGVGVTFNVGPEENSTMRGWQPFTLEAAREIMLQPGERI